VAYDIFNSMHGDFKVVSAMVITLDMSKGYDQVEWPFFAEYHALIGF